jgi:tetratricopeptide (TPR) repeat protein
MAARLAILSIKGLDPNKWSSFESNRIAAQIWMELANARRLAAEWDGSEDALRRSAANLGGEKLLEARWLSISASLKSDRGFRTDALTTLERCRTLYEEENDWFSAGKSLIQMGHILVDQDPRRGLMVLERARPIVSPFDPILLWLLEVTRTECLIETKQYFQALNAFRAAEEYKRFQPRPRAEIRSKFTAGRLLEALGHRREAERLFEEVVAADLEHAFLKDSFMDLLYLFAFYLKFGEPVRAAELGRRALSQLELLDSIHDQLKSVWRQLIEATDRRSVDLQLVAHVKEYIRVWWRRPGPGFAFVDTYGARTLS